MQYTPHENGGIRVVPSFRPMRPSLCYLSHYPSRGYSVRLLSVAYAALFCFPRVGFHCLHAVCLMGCGRKKRFGSDSGVLMSVLSCIWANAPDEM